MTRGISKWSIQAAGFLLLSLAILPSPNVGASADYAHATGHRGPSFGAAVVDSIIDPVEWAKSESSTMDAASDISTTIEGPRTVVAGTKVEYRAVITNKGPSDSGVVDVTMVMPPGSVPVGITPLGQCTGAVTAIACRLESIAAGDAVILTIQAVSPPHTTESYVVTIEALGRVPDPDPDNNSDRATFHILMVADMGVRLVDAPSEAVVNSATFLVFEVANNGPSVGAGAGFAIIMPDSWRSASIESNHGSCQVIGAASSCNLGPMNAGELTTITLTGSLTESGSFLALAEVQTNANDLDPGNDTVEVAVRVAAAKAPKSTPAPPATPTPTVSGGGGGCNRSTEPRAGRDGAVELAFMGLMLGGMRVWRRRNRGPSEEGPVIPSAKPRFLGS